MEFRNILFFLTFLFTISLANSLGTSSLDSLSTITSTSSAPSSVSSCIANGRSCSGKKKSCCSGFCRCEVKNPFMCTCSNLHPSGLASREDADAQECRPDLSHCKQDSDCCSNKCYGFRLGGLVCWSPPSKTADTGLASATYSPEAKGVVGNVDDNTCKANGEDCSGRQDVKCCSGYCWCSPLNPGGCTCAMSPKSDAVADDSGTVGEVTREVEQPPLGCAKVNEPCTGHNDDCCSGFCWCKLLNPFDCTCAKRMSVDNIAIFDERDITDSGPSASDEEPSLRDENEDGEAYKSWPKPKPKPKPAPAPKCVADSDRCDHGGDCCSKKCESGHCHSTHQAVDRRQDFGFRLDTSDDITNNGVDLLTEGVPHGLPCKINNSKCADNQDCCSGNCKSNKCQKKSLEIRDVTSGVPPIPPCQKDEYKCFMHNQCCSHHCEAGICMKKTLEDRVVDLVRTETHIDDVDDKASSSLAESSVPPPPCKGAGVSCRNHRDCCYGKCMTNKKCWKPTEESS